MSNRHALKVYQGLTVVQFKWLKLVGKRNQILFKSNALRKFFYFLKRTGKL